MGGCVRDSVLGKTPSDWDITTSALPEQVKSLFKATVDTGIQHGTVMVIKGGEGYEVTTYRVDGEYRDGRHPESVTFTRSLEEDLKRRDFTINAFAYRPEEGLKDFFGGLEDLENGIIRAVGDPNKRFAEDALRIMRAVRFAAQLSFEIEPETKSAISRFGPMLANVSMERIRTEFEKTLFSANPFCVGEYKELGLSGYIVPDFSERCFLRRSDPLYANMKGEALTEADRVIRLSAFFMGLSADECRQCMRNMTFDNHSAELTSGVLKNFNAEFEPTGVCVRRALKSMGLTIFKLTVGFFEACGKNMTEVGKTLEGVLERGEATDISHLAVTGNDLIAEGVPKGVEVGRILSDFLDRVVEDPSLNTREKLLALLHEKVV